MKINDPKFVLSAVHPRQYPVGNLPEVAFAGRSNVGKSSIINTLLNRKSIARVGATPGKTREINFYDLDQKLYFVDLPGYGYARVSKEKKAGWGDVITTYLNTRETLALIVMMVDIRHTPSEDDGIMFEWIRESGISYVIVASKADKVTRSQIKPRLGDIAKTLGLRPEDIVVPFSSETRQGKEEVWGRIDGMMEVMAADSVKGM